MKTLLIRILVVALMLGTATSNATVDLNKISTFKYVNKGSHISVSDSSGEVIYRGLVKYNGNLTTLFDFTNLKNGKYKVEITRDYEIEINTIEVKNSEVKFLSDLQRTIHKPVFRSQDAKLLISKLALNDSEMNIELYFEDDLIHTETVKGDKILNRVYKLDQTLKGNYTAIIRSDGRVFVEDFRI